MTTFVTFSQFATEHPTAAGFRALNKRMYTANHKDGSTREVKGVALCDKSGTELCCLALSQDIESKTANEIAAMAKDLNVAKQEYVDKSGKQAVMCLLCTGRAQATGELATFSL